MTDVRLERSKAFKNLLNMSDQLQLDPKLNKKIQWQIRDD